MKWCLVKKYRPNHQMGLHLVAVESDGATDVYLATYEYHEETDSMQGTLKGCSISFLKPIEVEE